MVAMSVAGAAKSTAQSPYSSNADFAEHARMLREHELLKVEPQVFVALALEREHRDHGVQHR